MNTELLADKILVWLGNTPAAYPQENDKWPVIFADLFFNSIPIIFALLLLFPFFWLWYKKKKLTVKNFLIALLQSVGLIIAGIIALFLLFSFMLGQIAQEIN